MEVLAHIFDSLLSLIDLDGTIFDVFSRIEPTFSSIAILCGFFYFLYTQLVKKENDVVMQIATLSHRTLLSQHFKKNKPSKITVKLR